MTKNKATKIAVLTVALSLCLTLKPLSSQAADTGSNGDTYYTDGNETGGASSDGITSYGWGDPGFPVVPNGEPQPDISAYYVSGGTAAIWTQNGDWIQIDDTNYMIPGGS